MGLLLSVNGGEVEEQLFRAVAVLNLKNRRLNILATISILIIYCIAQEVKSDSSEFEKCYRATRESRNLI